MQDALCAFYSDRNPLHLFVGVDEKIISPSESLFGNLTVGDRGLRAIHLGWSEVHLEVEPSPSAVVIVGEETDPHFTYRAKVGRRREDLLKGLQMQHMCACVCTCAYTHPHTCCLGNCLSITSIAIASK